MKTYKVKNTKHVVYKTTEVPRDIEYRKDWKNAHIGDWVKTDDGHVVQILRKDNFTVGTCTGTYSYTDDSRMDSVRKKDIYSVSGENWYTRLKNRKEPTKREVVFAKRIQRGGEPAEIYAEIFKTTNKKNAKEKAALLIKSERIQKIMNEDLKDVFANKGVDLDYLIGSAKDVVDGAKNDSDRLKALNMLWDAFGVVKQQKVTEIAGVFQGFDLKHIEGAERKQIEDK